MEKNLEENIAEKEVGIKEKIEATSKDVRNNIYDLLGMFREGKLTKEQLMEESLSSTKEWVEGAIIYIEEDRNSL